MISPETPGRAGPVRAVDAASPRGSGAGLDARSGEVRASRPADLHGGRDPRPAATGQTEVTR